MDFIDNFKIKKGGVKRTVDIHIRTLTSEQTQAIQSTIRSIENEYNAYRSSFALDQMVQKISKDTAPLLLAPFYLRTHPLKTPPFLCAQETETIMRMSRIEHYNRAIQAIIEIEAFYITKVYPKQEYRF